MIDSILQQLRAERQRIDNAISALERTPSSSVKKRTGRPAKLCIRTSHFSQEAQPEANECSSEEETFVANEKAVGGEKESNEVVPSPVATLWNSPSWL